MARAQCVAVASRFVFICVFLPRCREVAGFFVFADERGGDTPRMSCGRPSSKNDANESSPADEGQSGIKKANGRDRTAVAPFGESLDWSLPQGWHPAIFGRVLPPRPVRSAWVARHSAEWRGL